MSENTVNTWKARLLLLCSDVWNAFFFFPPLSIFGGKWKHKQLPHLSPPSELEQPFLLLPQPHPGLGLSKLRCLATSSLADLRRGATAIHYSGVDRRGSQHTTRQGGSQAGWQSAKPWLSCPAPSVSQPVGSRAAEHSARASWQHTGQVHVNDVFVSGSQSQHLKVRPEDCDWILYK